ncbi:hypothetical protein [Luteibacter yeojuensis]|uniref:Uncharacterized protein n=1 Tax=Luteibacter yeojuensis TaxID=345309 RepID=A0A7X5QXT9_9GAMM|nr:hypothetical protein [Luteibacter yeojuensis]NID17381.1 hypothetical protein [Luteibacter yeojuensis]
MASIFTGLAFMHGHIVDRELVLRLGRGDQDRGAGVRRTETPARPCCDTPSLRAPLQPTCATC